ncbi:MAG TPA: hypothetical protein PKI03_33860, partial [Pseudomonadota bacterium]|nr:hypothetical protein [Pseudomonadota bacterium]
MSPLASLLPLLWLFTPAPLLTADALRVVTDEPALGEEIARAARRYVRGPIEIDRRGDPGGSRSDGAVPPASRRGAPEGTAEPTAVLRVQRSQADAKAERWELLLSLGGTRIVARSITLRATESRFDLAEAVAIGLPDMLARLSEVRHGGAPGRTPSSAPSQASPELPPQPPSPATVSVGPRRLAMRAVSSHSVKGEPSLPVHSARPRGAAPTESVLPPTVDAPAPPAEAVGQESASSSPRPASPRPAPPSPAPAAAPVAAASESVATAPKRESEKPPVAPAVVAAPRPAPPLPSPSAEAGSARTPPAAIALSIGGAVALFAGLATGSAALLAARQIDSPQGGRFDAELDRRGRALDTATIVLD